LILGIVYFRLGLGDVLPTNLVLHTRYLDCPVWFVTLARIGEVCLDAK